MAITDDLREIPSWMWLGGAAGLGLILFLKARSNNAAQQQPIMTSGSLLPSTANYPIGDYSGFVNQQTPPAPTINISPTVYTNPQQTPSQTIVPSSTTPTLNPPWVPPVGSTLVQQPSPQTGGTAQAYTYIPPGQTSQAIGVSYSPDVSQAIANNTIPPNTILFLPHQYVAGGPIVNIAPGPYGNGGGSLGHPADRMNMLTSWANADRSNYTQWVNQGRALSAGGAVHSSYSPQKNVRIVRDTLARQIALNVGPPLPVRR